MDDVERRLRQTLNAAELDVEPGALLMPEQRRRPKALLAAAASLAAIAAVATTAALMTRSGDSPQTSLDFAATTSTTPSVDTSPDTTPPTTAEPSPSAVATSAPPTTPTDPNLALTEDCGPAKQSMNGNVLDFLCPSGKTSRSAYLLLKPQAPHVFGLDSHATVKDVRAAVCADLKAGYSQSPELSALSAAAVMFDWSFRNQAVRSDGLPDC